MRESQLFIKDNSGVDDPDVKSGMKTGLHRRSMYTNKGQIVEMEGPIHIDIFQQNRLLVNGVGLALKLWPSKDGFRLISNEDDASYKVQIVDVSFNLCLQKPNAGCPDCSYQFDQRFTGHLSVHEQQYFRVFYF